MNSDVQKTPDVENENVHERVIGNTTFKVVSYYSDKRTYEDIVKNAILREIRRDY